MPPRVLGVLEPFKDLSLELRADPLVKAYDPNDGCVGCLKQDDPSLTDLVV